MSWRKRLSWQGPLSLPLLSGFLLTLSYPKYNFGFLAWFALVPLLFSISYAKTRSQALRRGFITGIIFFSLSLSWMRFVTGFGLFFLTFLEGLFILLFAGLVFEIQKSSKLLVRILGAACAWLIAEWIRSEIPVFGLGWNLLAYSQSDYLPIIQFANLIGAYGLGFLIVIVNVCVVEVALTRISSRPLPSARGRIRPTICGGKEEVILPIFFAVLILFGILGYGHFQMSRAEASTQSLKVSVLQGNIPQSIKWEVIARDKIFEIYEKLTDIAMFEKPNLIVWPEAAFPGYFNADLQAGRIKEKVKQSGVPALIGGLYLTGAKAYNSAYLLNADGQIKDRYDKQYLVPFGEYVPLEPIFSFLEPLAQALGVSDFHQGKEAKVMSLWNDEVRFSVLICFEDVFSRLANRFADNGAQFLAVITNDAWFGDSQAPYQHLQASVFRAVETGLPVIRSANTGLSAFITREGKVTDRVANQGGDDIFVAGQKTVEIKLNGKKTFYRKLGWLFPYFAMLGFVILCFLTQKERGVK